MYNPRAHTNTQKLIWNISVITDAFLDQKKVNVCEHAVMMAPVLPSCLATPLVALFITLTWGHHYHVSMYIYSLLIEKGICYRRNISNKFPCLCMPFLQISLNFLVRFFPLFSNFCVFHTSVPPFPHSVVWFEFVIPNGTLSQVEWVIAISTKPPCLTSFILSQTHSKQFC